MSSNEGEQKKPRKEKKKKNQNPEPQEESLSKEIQTLQIDEEKPSFFDKLPEQILNKEHQFWHHQPVLKISESATDFEPIEKKTVDEISKEPYKLPDNYEWYEIDVNDDNEMQQIFDLLENNYVEDDEAMFRFAYPVSFLRWALTPPKWKKSWHVAVRAKKTKVFAAFISAVPAKFGITVNSSTKKKQLETVEINFLCVHKKLRSKRLAPLLIQEITRRVNVENIWQAVYTAGILIPKPFSVTRYYHRSLNYKKLIEIGFTRVPKRFQKFPNPLKMLDKLYELPSQTTIPGFRKTVSKDVPQIYEKLTVFLTKFRVSPLFTQKEVAHLVKPKDNVLYSYVVEDPETKEITDFISWYNIPSSIINNKNHKILKAAYLYYYFNTKHTLAELMTDALVEAKKEDFDVFNCLDILDNKTFIEDLKFGAGDGNLYYYFYNYKTPEIDPSQLGLVML